MGRQTRMGWLKSADALFLCGSMSFLLELGLIRVSVGNNKKQLTQPRCIRRPNDQHSCIAESPLVLRRWSDSHIVPLLTTSRISRSSYVWPLRNGQIPLPYCEWSASGLWPGLRSGLEQKKVADLVCGFSLRFTTFLCSKPGLRLGLPDFCSEPGCRSGRRPGCNNGI